MHSCSALSSAFFVFLLTCKMDISTELMDIKVNSLHKVGKVLGVPSLNLIEVLDLL